MAWIKVVDEDAAEGDLKAEYEDVQQKRGRVSNIMKVHSLDPKAMRLHLDLYLHLMFGKSTLTRAQREMIAVRVSQTNGCEYCVAHHREALLTHVHDQSVAESLRMDLTGANITAKDRGMLRYATKLTKSPSEVSAQDIGELRVAGFTDEEILRLNLITSYFNFVNRIASGLGVSLEAADERTYKY
jgi:uncharacterized peroxidase-related enzyme